MGSSTKELESLLWESFFGENRQILLKKTFLQFCMCSNFRFFMQIKPLFVNKTKLQKCEYLLNLRLYKCI